MAVNNVHCHFLNGNITVITDFNGNIKNVVCPSFDNYTKLCNEKCNDFQGGTISAILASLSKSGQIHCEFFLEDGYVKKVKQNGS